MKKIGILLIHGIGDQPRYRHLHEFTELLVSGLCGLYDRKRISIEAPGVRTRQGQAPVSVLVTPPHLQDESKSELVERFDLYEVWWRDLAQQPKLSAILRFWWWATTLAGTRGLFREESPTRLNPKTESRHERKKIGLAYRFTLFFKVSFIFLLLAPIAVICDLISIIPGFRRFPFIRAVFIYLNSVQLYQETSKKVTGELTDFDNARRISIQRRLINMMLTLHESDCDYWYIFAHSLGSVIGFKGLMYDNRAFARLMSYDRWNHPQLAYLHCKDETEDEYYDIPRVPNWLQTNDAIRVTDILSRLRGFVTYGSPLETFARTWPAIVQINPATHAALARVNAKENSQSEDISKPNLPYEWLNIYDPSDLVASKLKSFAEDANPALNGICPQEVSIQSSLWVPSAHVKYFKARHVFKYIIRWMEVGDKKFQEIRETKELSKIKIIWRHVVILIELFIAFLVCAIMWPFSMFFLLSTIEFAVDRLAIFMTEVLKLFTEKIWYLGIITNDELGCRVVPDAEQQYHTNLAYCVHLGFSNVRSFIQNCVNLVCLNVESVDFVTLTEHAIITFFKVACLLALAALFRSMLEKITSFTWFKNMTNFIRSKKGDTVQAAVLYSDLDSDRVRGDKG